MGLSSLITYVQLAFKSMFSYKRRTLSIVAGMILGAAIFSSVFFYGAIVKSITIMDVLGNIEAEVNFSPLTTNLDDPVSIANTLKDQPEIADTAIIYGYNWDVDTGDNESFNMNLDLISNLSIIKNEQPAIFVSPKIVDETDVNSTVINKLHIYTGKNDLSEGSCLVSLYMYKNYGITVNTVLSFNFTINVLSFNSSGFPIMTYIKQVSLNLTVKGIFQTKFEGKLLGSYFSQDDILFSSSNLDSDIIDKMKDFGSYDIACSLDYNKLPVGNIKDMSDKINSMINRIQTIYNGEIYGDNLVGLALTINTIQVTLMQVVDFILYIPGIILSIILINFGADLALQERKYEVSVLKAQGASPKQIEKMIFTEVLIIGTIGEIIGIGLGTVGASVVVSSFSFMQLDISRFTQAYAFLKISLSSIIVTALFTLGILLLTTRKKTRTFIKQEVVEGKQIEKQKTGFFKRIYFDIITFGLGLLGVALAFIREIKPEIGLQGWTVFLQILSPIILWYASGEVSSRIAPKIPQMFDKYIVKVFKDIGLLIKGSLGRRHQNFPKITLLLCLSVSLAVFTAIQGETGTAYLVQQVQTSVGGDMRIDVVTGVHSLTAANFTGFEDKIESIVVLYYTTTSLQSGNAITLLGADLSNYSANCYWDRYSIVNYANPHEALSVLQENPLVNVGVDRSTYKLLELDKNPKFGIKVENKTIHTVESKITIDHAPAITDLASNAAGFKALVDYSFLEHFYNLSDIYASRVVVNLKPGVDPISSNLAINLKANFSWVKDVESYEDVLNQYREAEGRNFGIPGLLSINYIVAIVTAIIGVFIFMMLIINRRRKEFAILTAEGSSKMQIIKLVISEILSLALFATIFGSIIGYLFAYQFNGFISFFDTVLSFGSLTFKRHLFIPLSILLVTIIGSFVAIIAATLIPAITASRVKVVEEMRVV